LANLGYQVVASTGRPNESEYLRRLGAAEVIDRKELSEPGKPLQKERWSAAVDSVGSHTLANVCAQIRYGGVVAACGMAQGLDFPASVAPFILRGMSLLGVDSVMRPKGDRLDAWERLARDLHGPILEEISDEIPLGQSIDAAARLMRGEVRGRLIVNPNDA
jgi:acrylyl-CoA reductase (NADPH)